MSRATTDFRLFTRMGWGGRAASHFRGLVSSPDEPNGQVGTLVYRSPGGFANWEIAGVTRTSTGAVLASCVIDLFETGSDLVKLRTVSDADGSFTLSNPGTGPFYLVAYKTGSPDVAGTTVQTVMPTAFVYPISTISPTTAQYTFGNVSGGMVGQVDPGTGGRVYMTAWINGGDAGALVLWVKGTDASAWGYHWDGNYANASGMLEVSVDDHAFTAPTGVSNKFPIFSGLSDIVHKVVIRCAAAYGGMYVVTSGNVIEATGAPSSVSVASSVVQYGSANTYWSSPIASKGTTWVPAPTNTAMPVSGTSGTYAVKLKTSSAYLDIVSRGAYVGVSIDGAAPTYYAMPTSKFLRVAASGTHDYYVFSIAASPNGTADMFSIGLDSAPLTTTAAKRLHQYGDSITYGAQATSIAHTDVQRVAAALGYVGQNIGISGQTTLQLVTNVTTQAAAANSTVANDIAILAIGRNDGSFSSTDFNSIVTTLLTYYKKVLVRGVLETGTSFTAYNASMSAWITGLANASVIYIDPEAWTGIATADGVHPTDAGYVTLAGYATTAYTPYV